MEVGGVGFYEEFCHGPTVTPVLEFAEVGAVLPAGMGAADVRIFF